MSGRPPRVSSSHRRYKIMILKLYAFVGSKGKLPPEIEGYVTFLYRQLWSGYPIDEELADRQEVDELLKQSKSPIIQYDRAV